jgi:hypothetical protein
MSAYTKAMKADNRVGNKYDLMDLKGSLTTGIREKITNNENYYSCD